ncbi:DegV family protein [bacterium C-53]|nr:DegV family protein [Lachnospiraceae bacterium]NBI03666.1 DegV family protein [Lachnospiraceae bacterium]RKJ09226.1 DegV family protein [bacterium C-53]
MSKTAIITDSNSGITQAEGKKLGITVIPMPFTIEGNDYFEDINLSQEEFYRLLAQNAEISTSQPAVGDLMDTWENLLKEYDDIVHIPMSSGLSSSCQTAITFAEEFDGRVQVVNNQRISVTQRQSVLDAIRLAENGKNASEIKKILEDTKFDSSIYIMVDTLKYLKKGGRVTPAAAAFAEILNLKPVLQIQGDKLDAFSKARGIKSARSIMIQAIKKDIEKRFGGFPVEEPNVYLQIAHTNNLDAALSFKEEIGKEFPGYDIYVDHLSLSVSCHIGPGSLALACTKIMKH